MEEWMRMRTVCVVYGIDDIKIMCELGLRMHRRALHANHQIRIRQAFANEALLPWGFRLVVRIPVRRKNCEVIWPYWHVVDDHRRHR